MEDAGRERAVDRRLFEYVQKMPGFAGAARGNQRDRACGAYRCELLDVVSVTDTVAVHAIEYHFARAPVDRFANPVKRVTLCPVHFFRIAGIPIDDEPASVVHAVDTENDTLRAEATRQPVDQVRVSQRRRIDGNLVCALVQHVFGVGNTPDAACDAKRDIQEFGDGADPAAIDGTSVGARGDVVKDEFVCALVAVATREFDDVADDAVFAKPDAFDDDPVPDVEAGNYASRRNEEISAAVMRPSRSARPVIADAAPVCRSVSRSLISRTPPEACNCTAG